MTISVLAVPLTRGRARDGLRPLPDLRRREAVSRRGIAAASAAGSGVMIDDLIAGVYALILLLVVRRLGWL